ncbi:hypothetical protein NQ317_015371, partial [Molorchus minor]
MLPDPEDFGIFYHEAYKIHPDSIKYKQKNKIELLPENDNPTAPEIELPGNASAFAVFASIRLAVLDRWMRQASQEYLQSSCSAPLQDQSEIESDTDDNSQSSCYIPLKVSKVVSLGLKSVFELIKESRISHPVLCTKALLALLDVLQGQIPEGLKSEPAEVINPLFDLMLDLATSHGPESSVPNDGSHLTAVACACLLSLVVVRGDTGKYLAATAALLMCPRALSLQNIQAKHMPLVLSSLQRSVHGVLLGKIIRPDWITHGVPSNSIIDHFVVRLPAEIHNVQLKLKSLACDGQYLYLFTSKGLLKIGSGYGGTLKGHIVMWKPDFYPNDSGNLVFCAENLYLKLCGRRGGEFLVVDRTNLLISGAVPLHNRDASTSVVFSDGDHLGIISSAKEDGFVVRMLNQNGVPASVVSELPLKLSRKCVDILGVASFEDEIGSYTVNTGSEEEIATISAGKEFGLIRTVTGKVLYCGKSSALGIKQAGIRTGKWSELVLTKTPKVTHLAVGHDGLHAILITEDGSVFFTGTARRGEDGDQSKVRRQPKAVKPKKMIKVDGQIIVSGACNNGTTALINKDGELLLFGKDTAHADPITGVVTSLKSEFVTQVSLGKAHIVALTSKGQAYTFGINNKYQCGREFNTTNKEGWFHLYCSSSTIVAMDTCGTLEEQDFYDDVRIENHKSDNIASGSDGNFGDSLHNMCPSGMHSWHDDMCMICTVCRECTGYSISCLSAMSSERNPGEECGCGEGDSGCAICGCCRICAREVVDNSELADLAGMMRLDLIFRDKTLIPARQRTKLHEQVYSKSTGRKKIKSKKSIQGSSKQAIKARSSRPSTNSTSSTQRVNNSVKTNLLGIVKEQTSSDVERDTTRISCLPPARIILPSDSPVVQIACGLHHTILLLQNGQVYTFGSNLYGQLGCGDILAKNNIQLVKLPCSAVYIAAGSNHSVVLTSRGEVYTFGNAQGASGDQTFLKLDESLINSISITKSTVTANKHSIILLPKEEETARNYKCLVINKRDGSCNSFKGDDHVDFSNKTVCLDYIYNVLWSFNAANNEFSCYNVIAGELKTNFTKAIETKSLSDVKTVSEASVTEKKNQLYIHHTLTQAHELLITTIKEEVHERQLVSGKQYSKEDFQMVNRFESHGGGWGYSGHSIEAIRFMADTDIFLGGFGLFGGRDGDLLTETEEIPYECGPRQKFPILFDEPVPLQTSSNNHRLLSAVLCALCAPTVRLRSTFPILGQSVSSESSLHRGLSPSDNTGLPMMSVSDLHHYPILVEQMSYKSQCYPKLTKYCCHLLARVIAELVHQCSTADEDLQATCGRTLHMTPSRFTRTNQSRTWNTGNGSPDAICFQVDRAGISIVGVGIYGGIGHYEYELELLEDTSSLSGSDSHTFIHRWNSLEITRGSFGPEDFAPDMIEIKFERPVPTKENVKYAIRLRNHGGRTNNGDGGLSSVKGSENTTFTFSTCSLSFNGTTLTRGQIPVILYYSNPLECGRTSTTKLEQQARKAALCMISAIVDRASKLMVLAREKGEDSRSASILSTSRIVITLLPLALAHISPLATSDSRSAVQILSLIQDLLPHVAALNLMEVAPSIGTKSLANVSTSITQDIVEHKINTTTNYKVKFSETVKWMSLEFDPACSTVQPEDSLQLYIPAVDYLSSKKYGNYLDDSDNPPLPYWPVLNKFSGSLQWPTNSVILPGNEVLFFLETASDYLKNERHTGYGFKCLVIGYEWPLEGNLNLNTGLKFLEAELAFLGGNVCCKLDEKGYTPAFMRRSVCHTVNDEDVDMDMAETVALEVFMQHGSLLSKGLALSSPPTVHQALDGMLPYRWDSTKALQVSLMYMLRNLMLTFEVLNDNESLVNEENVFESKVNPELLSTSFFLKLIPPKGTIINCAKHVIPKQDAASR